MRRRDLPALLIAEMAAARALFGRGASIQETLRAGVERHKIPAATAMVGNAEKVIYSGAFGRRDSASTKPLAVDAIFNIASMTKAITTAAAMQMVEQGKLAIDEPASKYLPELDKVQVLHGYDAGGKPILKPPTKTVTLGKLMTHTSGFCYSIWDQQAFEYQAKTRGTPAANGASLTLMFEPGTRWQYGTGIDWTGRMVEAVTGVSLEDYFQKHLLGPLGMVDTSYILKPEKFDRLVGSYSREAGGPLKEGERKMPAPPKSFNGGGGLYSTVGDYTRFMQMILNKGMAPGGQRLLSEKSVKLMSTNQTGSLQAGKMPTSMPNSSLNVDLHPGESDRYTYGFLLNQKAYPGGRSAGSLAWGGFYNTYYWIDPKRKLCATLMMQYLPFVDKEAIALLGEFERAVYAA
ncbi:MAG: serine hydrolase domain-containing protein [Acidobacteriota bacterium]